jgi:K+-sensing histidine kinase KdpD
MDFVEDLRTKLAQEQPEMAPGIDWQCSLGEEEVEIDPQLLQEAFLELFRNAGMHGRAEGVLGFQARRTSGAVEFVLREPKTQFKDETEDWGNRPLGKIHSGHYGLGLFRARGIFEAHHGIFRAHFDPAAAALTTIVALPLAS